MREAMHFWVKGRVQGVYFRANTKAKAQALGLTGWVRNLSGGEVEGVACGEPEALAGLKEWLAEGPELAQVTHLEVQPDQPKDWLSFNIE